MTILTLEDAKKRALEWAQSEHARLNRTGEIYIRFDRDRDRLILGVRGETTPDPQLELAYELVSLTPFMAERRVRGFIRNLPAESG